MVQSMMSPLLPLLESCSRVLGLLRGRSDIEEDGKGKKRWSRPRRRLLTRRDEKSTLGCVSRPATLIRGYELTRQREAEVAR